MTPQCLICKQADCDNWAKAQGYCAHHYYKGKRDGFILVTRKYIRHKPKYSEQYKRLKKLLSNIDQRCTYTRDRKFKYYGGKGIENHLTITDLVFLWERDRATRLTQPSIDRKDSMASYSLENCQFIEMAENRRKRSG